MGERRIGNQVEPRKIKYKIKPKKGIEPLLYRHEWYVLTD